MVIDSSNPKPLPENVSKIIPKTKLTNTTLMIKKKPRSYIPLAAYSALLSGSAFDNTSPIPPPKRTLYIDILRKRKINNVNT